MGQWANGPMSMHEEVESQHSELVLDAKSPEWTCLPSPSADPDRQVTPPGAARVSGASEGCKDRWEVLGGESLCMWEGALEGAGGGQPD